MAGLDFYDLEGNLLAFIGPGGVGGVLQFSESGGWRLHTAGSVVWDAFHQAAFRNFRAEHVSADDVRARGILLPTVPEMPPEKPWSSNFRSSLPLKDVPRALRLKLEAAGQITVHLVLEEDLYESALGDGRFLYPAAVFWELEKARKFALPTPQMSRTLRDVRLRVDRSRRELHADLAIEMFEHYSLNDILRLLGTAP